MTKVVQKIIKTKWFPSDFMNSVKIGFACQWDKETGEGIEKKLQSTLYVKKAHEDLPWQPQIVLSLKLGNDSLSLYADNIDEIERAIQGVLDHIAVHHRQVTQSVIEQRSEWLKMRNRAK